MTTRLPTLQRRRGFTLIELMVAVAVLAIVVSLAAPSFRRFIETQRVRAVNSQVVTDMQFARSEAASRNTKVRVTFASNSTMSCYTIYTYNNNNILGCDCTQTNPCAAAGADFTEIRTARFLVSDRVRVNSATSDFEFAFEPLAGGLYTIPIDEVFTPLASFTIRTRIDAQRELRTIIGQGGRPTVCAPSTSTIREAAC